MNANEMMINGRAAKRIELGGAVLWEKADDARMPDGLVCWYDVARQGCTNESLASRPILDDLSGNGHEMSLVKFVFDGTTNGMVDGRLKFGGGSYGVIPTLSELSAEPTIIAKRGGGNNLEYYCATVIGNGVFFEGRNRLPGRWVNLTAMGGSKLEYTDDMIPADGISWCNSRYYNYVPLGEVSDVTITQRYFFVCGDGSGTRAVSRLLDKLMIFNRSIDPDEIQDIISKYF